MVQDEPCVSNFRRARSSLLLLSTRHVSLLLREPWTTPTLDTSGIRGDLPWWTFSGVPECSGGTSIRVYHYA